MAIFASDRKMFGMVAAACGLVALASSPATAQRFSAPEKPASEPKEPAQPAPGQTPQPGNDADANRVPGGKFTLPLSLYDEKADAAADIQRAREVAKKDNRRVLVMWGENKCEFCAYLNELLTTDARLKQLIETEYVWVKVDIGKFDKNIALARRYNTPVDDPGDLQVGRQAFGAPALTIIDANNDQAISAAGGNQMVAKPMMPPSKVFDADFILTMLSGGRANPEVATLLMMEAQQKAKSTDKAVLTYFHIYGSESAAFWDKVVADAQAAEVLAKAFVPRKIDVERHVAGQSLLRRLKGSAAASPPWMTVVGADGKPLAVAGDGLAFDPTAAESAVKWLADASGGKLNETDQRVLLDAINRIAGEKEASATKK